MEGLGALPKISADPELLQQVFINLYSNSLHALGLGGVIKIAAEITDRGLLRLCLQPVWLRISFRR